MPFSVRIIHNRFYRNRQSATLGRDASPMRETSLVKRISFRSRAFHISRLLPALHASRDTLHSLLRFTRNVVLPASAAPSLSQWCLRQSLVGSTVSLSGQPSSQRQSVQPLKPLAWPGPVRSPSGTWSATWSARCGQDNRSRAALPADAHAPSAYVRVVDRPIAQQTRHRRGIATMSAVRSEDTRLNSSHLRLSRMPSSA